MSTLTLQSLRDRFRARRSGAAEAVPQEPQFQAPLAQLLTIEKQSYVVGFDWRFFSDRKDLGQTLRAARREGYTHHVVTQTEDLVGIARLAEAKLPKKVTSASLQLAQTLSRGGLELFLFQLQDELFCMVALDESRPMAGYEKVGPRQEIMALAGEFQLAQVGQTVRHVGNTGALEHEEPVKLSDAFARPEAFTEVKKIPDYKLLIIALAALVALGLLVFFVYGYFNQARLKAEMARLAQERDPNVVYERQIASGMQGIGLQAQLQLQRWRAVVNGIPMNRHGWALTGVSCTADECKLTWKRSFGSYADFFARPQAHEVQSNESQVGANPADSSIQTVLKVPAGPTPVALERMQLPAVTQVQRALASQLQDLSLMENSKVVLSAVELYPSIAGLSLPQIQRPVVRAAWEFTHELWTLNDLNFALPSLALDSLSIYPDAATQQWFYTLKGRFYAKGKDY